MKLPKVESLVILIFFGIVALWAISKCSAKRGEMTKRLSELAEEEDDRPARRDTVVVKTPVQSTPPAVSTATPGATPALQNQSAVTVPPTTPGTKPQRPVLGQPAPQTAAPVNTPTTTAAAPKYSTLYVTIDGLKLREEPSLKGAVVAKLKLYEPVSFMNQKTEKTEEISLGYEKVTDHWVKVRTKAGKEGWVFGAGVHYYKMKRKGVLE